MLSVSSHPVFVPAGAWIGIQHLAYTEFGTASRIVFSGTFRRLLNAQLELAAFRADLTAASTAEKCWEVLHQGYSEFGFYEIRAKMGDRVYMHSTNGHLAQNSWTIRIALSGSEYVNLTSEFDTHALPMIGPLADTISTVMRSKIAAMQEAEAIGQVKPALEIPRKPPESGSGHAVLSH